MNRYTSGVFVYGPRPVYHRTYVVNNGPASQPVQVEKAHLPTRKVDRDDSFAIGMKAGSYLGVYDDGTAFGDLGLGLTGRYRPHESVGIQLDVTHYNQTWTPETERAHTSGSASAMLFAFPWKRVSPYVMGGLTFTDRDIHDDVFNNGFVGTVTTTAPKFGPHMGLGAEFALGKSIALDIEARYTPYLNPTSDATTNHSLQTSAGILVHF